MRVLVACEFSGTVREAFAARGHDAWSCDLAEAMADQWGTLCAEGLCKPAAVGAR
jgi:hypothetical protein